MGARKVYHVTFSGKHLTEGFITDDRWDADWTATGRPASNVVPTIGDDIRGRLDNPRSKLPRRYALLFRTEEEAEAAMTAIAARDTPTPEKG
jgi:hypothetical protein